MVGVRFAVEVGTFTGYSSISIARGLARRGKLLCCDVSEEWTAIARRYWKSAGLDKHIELRLGPAIETLQALPDRPHIDLAFIDADKTSYLDYWEELVPRMRPGGVILVDNVLSSGSVVDPSVTDADTVADSCVQRPRRRRRPRGHGPLADRRRTQPRAPQHHSDLVWSCSRSVAAAVDECDDLNDRRRLRPYGGCELFSPVSHAHARAEILFDDAVCRLASTYGKLDRD
jgi:hypothetical protein